MPVAVHCPTCGQELVAPDELIGQIAACPGCNAQFPVSNTGQGKRVVPPPPPPPSGQRPAPRATPTADAAPPAVAKQPARSKQQAAPATSTPRAARPARFIAGESTETTIELGRDGQLPMLVLTEGKANAATEADGQKSNPLLLVGVLCFSLLASLSMLLLDTTAYYAEPDSKTEAREQIEAHYVKGKPLRAPYQDELAAALQAHHKRDYAQERTRYKQVLKMLREENKTLTGVTGRAEAPKLPDGELLQPNHNHWQPNDEHLESLLRTLLR
jgi:hypothetical protein